MNIKTITIIGFSILLILMTSCSPETQLEFTPTGLDTSLPTSTLTIVPTELVTPSPVVKYSATPLPSPTPTLRVHQVKLGETMGGIAWQYGVSLDALITLNPDIPPYAMSVGAELLIPNETVVPANYTPLPTAISMPVDGLNCVPEESGGIWCFLEVENTASYPLESVIVNINVADLDASQVYAQQASSPLNVLPVGEKMPFAVFFPGKMPDPFQSSAQFVSAVPLEVDLNRYVDVELKDVEIQKAADQKLALVNGKFSTAVDVSTIRIVAVAYDQEGQIIGLRRWQQQFDNALQQGEFSLEVFAAQGEIDSVVLKAEAQP